MGAQEIAEIVRRSQVMEKALRGVMTTGAGATAVTGYLQAKGHGEVVGIIASGRALCDNMSLLLLPSVRSM